MEFPCYMWDAWTGEKRLFKSEEEFKKAGGEWVDSPAKIRRERVKRAPTRTTESEKAKELKIKRVVKK